MSDLARLAARLYAQPLLMEAEIAAFYDDRFRAYIADPKNVEREFKPTTERAEEKVVEAMGTERLRRSDGGYLATQDGIAIIPVLGSLVQRSGGMDTLSGMTSYAQLGSMFAAAEADPSVRGIVLDVDSPGGEVAGAFELASMIRQAKKPVYAVANEFATSAAYLLSSAADTLNAPATASVGSIGVVTMHVDQSKANEKRGVAVTHIYAGDRKVDFSPYAPLSDAARAQAQARIDKLYTHFVDAIGGDGRITADQARATEAGVLDAADALDAGLIDGVATLSETVTQLRNELNSARSFGGTFTRRASRANEREIMSDANKAPAATISAEQAAELQAKSFAEGKAEGVKELTTAVAAATKAERERIKTIAMSTDAVERPTLASHLAFDQDMSAEAALAMLAKAGKEAPGKPADAFAAAMAKQPNPAVGADAVDPTKPAKVVPLINTQSIYDKRAAQARAK